jgi:hypothetical protein
MYEPDEPDYTKIPHKYIADIYFTIDTSGESCVCCSLGEGSKVHDKYRVVPYEDYDEAAWRRASIPKNKK